jgi:putative addiction module component (TIGR02574 family)
MLPIEDRIRLVEDIWDSVAEDQLAFNIFDTQRAELDKHLDALEEDRKIGRQASEVILELRNRL